MKPNYSYLANELSDASLMIFDAMAEMIMPEGSNEAFEANKWYRASDLKKILGVPVPSASLNALVARGLVEDDRDKNGKLYCITDEMYDLIDKVYWRSKEKAMAYEAWCDEVCNR
jgi:hypothetical protein